MKHRVMPALQTTSPCMAKLDRLGWVEGLCVDAYGLRIGIRYYSVFTQFEVFQSSVIKIL